MPGNYAHYRFGVGMISQFPPQARQTIRRHRRLYDMGLHGPDLFFFYKPLSKTAVGELGHHFHYQTGREFFSRCVRSLRLQPSEAATAYLYGVLAHYALDKRCHPFIKDLHSRSVADHSALESEFERYLLELDGKPPAFAREMGRHMKLTEDECAAAVRMYPPARREHIRSTVRFMRFCAGLFSLPEGLSRRTVEAGMKILCPKKMGMLIPQKPDLACMEFNAPLHSLYDAAAEEFPVLLQQLLAHLDHGGALGPEFDEIFG